ncbi:MAG: hypothetical protein AMXMBFR81_17820 [Chthonomonas sp.]
MRFERKVAPNEFVTVADEFAHLEAERMHPANFRHWIERTENAATVRRDTLRLGQSQRRRADQEETREAFRHHFHCLVYLQGSDRLGETLQWAQTEPGHVVFRT